VVERNDPAAGVTTLQENIMSKLWKCGLLAAAFAVLTAGTCPQRTVVIHYTPLLNTSKLASGGGDGPAGPGVFRFYKITSIENMATNAQNFHFSNGHIFVNEPDKAELLHVKRSDGSLYSDQGLEEDVAPHTTSSNVHYLVLYDVNGTAGAEEWAPLRYDNSETKDSILFVPEPSNPKPPYIPAVVEPLPE
jgi:hypothetical protein